MHEIAVQSLRPQRNAGEQRVRRRRVERVPAHVRESSATGRAARSCRPRRRIHPRPSVTSYSRPRSAINCMPTQMPRNGRPLPRTVCSSASTMPGTASRPRRQSAKAPTPGNTMRSARRTASGSLVTRIGCRCAGFARGALEGLSGGMQIARTVVDDRDGHARAPGFGKRSRRRPAATEERSVTAGGQRRNLSHRRARDPGVEKAPFRGLDIVGDDDPEIVPAPAEAWSAAGSPLQARSGSTPVPPRK